MMIDALVGRLRPVLVTSLSTFGGVMPTAYGLGGWDSIMSPMSLALGWGLALLVGRHVIPGSLALHGGERYQSDRSNEGTQTERSRARASTSRKTRSA